MKRVAQQDMLFSKGDILVCPRCFSEVPTEGLGKRWYHPQQHRCECGVSYVIEKGKVTYVDRNGD